MTDFNLGSTQDPKIRVYAPELALLYDMVHKRIAALAINARSATSPEAMTIDSMAFELAKVELKILELWREVIANTPKETVEGRVRQWVTELTSTPTFSNDLAVEKNELLRKLSWVLHEPIVTAVQQQVRDDLAELQAWHEWVGYPIRKKSGKPFPDGRRIVVAGHILINKHSGKPAFSIGDNRDPDAEWVVDCHMCELVG